MFTPNDFPQSGPTPSESIHASLDLPTAPVKMPKGKKKRRKAWKQAQRDRDQLLMQLGRERRENELLRDVIRMSASAADHRMDTRAARTGLALSKRKTKKGGGRR